MPHEVTTKVLRSFFFFYLALQLARFKCPMGLYRLERVTAHKTFYTTRSGGLLILQELGGKGRRSAVEGQSEA